ncbi:hypothetical protein G6F22_009704 [Rhizopus arrhizus]|nr:hypothetical protein G6F22_009704 [Rhizopus arrhizus]
MVVVVACAGLQLVAAEAALVLHEHAGVATAVDEVARAAAIQVVFAPVHAGAQQLAFGQADIALQRGAVAVGLRTAEYARCAIVVRFVVAAADVGSERHAFGGGVAQLAGQHLLAGFGVVVVAVVMVPAVGAQRAAFHVPLVVEGVAATQALGQVAVAVAVVFVGKATGSEHRGRAAAGIDAIGMLVGDVGAKPAAFGAATDATAGFAQAVAATAELEVRGKVTGIAAGEDLDHATDGIGAIQAGLRSAHDLHALDLRQRQVLVHGQAEVGAVDAHAVDQHHGVAGVGAAQEQRALLAKSAGVGQVDAGAAAQQFLQRGRSACGWR